MKDTEFIKQMIKGKSSLEILQTISSLKDTRIVFSSSLGPEDQVLTHLIFRNELPISIFTLDTGRLFPETYSLLEQTRNTYRKEIQVFFPNTKAVEELVTSKGPLSFYSSVENRKECCYIRKVEPLKRALQGADIWITGIRADQSENRNNMENVEWDEAHQLIKIHPLLHWCFEEVMSFIKANNIPHNSLHQKGFVSIGCQPCTRAIKAGEDFRAGRWWWEDNSKKECGLHR